MVVRGVRDWPLHLAALHVAIRIGLANTAPITDCDEVFNYWEPLHFLQYGFGMQTWEYSPTFALRTYAYLLPLHMISKIYTLVFSCEKVQLFHLLRITLAFFVSISELHLVKSIPSKWISYMTWIFLISSAGMYHSSPALLPSSTVMMFVMNSMAEQFHFFTKVQRNDDIPICKNHLHRAIVWGLLAVLVTGWPFCGILFVPLGFQAVFYAYQSEKKKNGLSVVAVILLLLRVFAICTIIQICVMVIDYRYYGKIISPTWNIFVYNTGYGLAGDDGINRDILYGVDDYKYYIKNLLLNWNGVAIMSFVALPIIILDMIVSAFKRRSEQVQNISHSQMILTLLPMYLWSLVVFSRPHKEERFLFPIYPYMALGASVSLNYCVESTGLHKFFVKTVFKTISTDAMKAAILTMIILPCALFGISRSMVLSDGYTAPLTLYSNLSRVLAENHALDQLVCVGGEWYRFPSSYHLSQKTSLAFLKSSFDGQLPQAFTKHGSREQSLLEQGNFNDWNREEMDRYVDISDCAYAIELVKNDVEDRGSSEVERYMEEDEYDWELLEEVDFLNTEDTSFLHRVLYVPFIRKVSYQKYALFKRKNK